MPLLPPGPQNTIPSGGQATSRRAIAAATGPTIGTARMLASLLGRFL
jgi:hypothetical protein